MSPKKKQNTGNKHKSLQKKSGVEKQNIISGKVDGIALQDVVADQIEVQQIHREATPEEIREQERNVAQAYLRRSVRDKFNALKEIARSEPDISGNPYRFLQPHAIDESRWLMGRDEDVSRLLAGWKKHNCQFLAGNSGIGKTSLILAGLIPALLKEGHLPLFIEAQDEPLDISIKKQLLPDLNLYPFLRDLALSEFLREVTAILRGAHLYLLIDRLESFFNQPSETQDSFKNEWALAISSAALEVHWLFSIQMGCSFQLSFFQPQVQPFTNLTVLAPLTRDASRKAILIRAREAGIQIEDNLIETILNDLSQDGIDPLELQLVCYTLAGGNESLVTEWDDLTYEARGRVDGILQSYLEQAINELPPAERKPAWLVLSTLAEPRDRGMNTDKLVDHMKTFIVERSVTLRVVENLKKKHLVNIEDENYRLSSANLLPKIQQWQTEQAAFEQARQEYSRQIEQIRNSAIRGLFGGAIGFAGFGIFAFVLQNLDWLINLGFDFLFFFIFLTATIGGVAGLISTLSMDVAFASYHGGKGLKRILFASLGCSFAMGMVLALYTGINRSGEGAIFPLVVSFIEGGIWGGATGVGLALSIGSRLKSWSIVLYVSILSSFILLCVDWIGHALAGTHAFLKLSGSLIFIAAIGILILWNRQRFISGGDQ